MSRQVASLTGQVGDDPFPTVCSSLPELIVSQFVVVGIMASDLPSVVVDWFADRWVSCYGNPDDDESQSESFEIVCDLIR